MPTPVEVALAEERRSARLVLRLNPTDAAEVEARAVAVGLSRTELCRAFVRAGLSELAAA
jgi:hypothetical protein